MGGNLMSTVTALEKIPRLKGWFDLVFDGKVSFPVNEELILKYLIRIGEQYLPGKIKEIRQQGEYMFLKKKALDALARRRLSEKELRRKLRKQPKVSTYIDRLINDLKGLGLIDDQTYAAAVIHTLQAGGAKSKRYIKSKLYQKGVDTETTEKAVDGELADYDETEAAMIIATKKYRSVKDLPTLKAKKRIADFLRGRGFGWEDISNALDKLFDRDD
jgi:SOS response regulatory protein OraA/RecX